MVKTLHRYGLSKKLITALLLFLYISIDNNLQAQSNRYNDNWFFGNYAGIMFSGLNAAALSGSVMIAPEGTATISDASGQLLYYTNGNRVWGSDHQIIINGDNLTGNPSSTQSALFLPQPESGSITYLFTTDADGGQNGLRYSVLEKDVSNTGRILSNKKNLLLRTPVTEKITAFRHCNQRSYWIVAHAWGSNIFYSYLLTDEELETTPVITPTGPIYTGVVENGIGYMKASPYDNLLALAVTGSNRVDIFSFDNAEGTPDFLYSIENIFQPYGIEFNETQSLLYVSGLDGRIYQYNLTAQDVPASGVVVANTGKLTGALQMAPNGRIYVSKDLDLYLGYIASPNSISYSCNYIDQGVYLGGNYSKAGLPPYIPNLEKHALEQYDICYGDTVWYNPLFLQKADSFIVYFGDRYSINYDSTTILPAWHVFEDFGYNIVEAVYYMCGEEYSVSSFVCMQGEPEVYIGEDTAICENIEYTIITYPRGIYCPSAIDFIWCNGSTDPFLKVYPPGNYSVTITNQCGSGIDSINITGLPVPEVSLVPDKELCVGDTAMLIPLPFPDSLLWYDGSNDSLKIITETGNYFVTAINEYNCRATANVLITFIEPPTFQWNMRDTTICIGVPMELNAGAGFDSYLWHDNSSGPLFIVADSGWYRITVSNMCGKASDSLYVYLEDCRLRLYVPNAFNPNGDGLNDIFRAYGQYIDEFQMYIYNRWGEMMFHSSCLENGWDGTFKGKVAPEGVYVYKIIYLDATNKYHNLSGTVTLIK